MADDREERREMVIDFVTESREMLDDIEPQILALEKHASDSGEVDDEILNTIFRLFHSLKGMASFLDLQTVIHVTHEAETLCWIFFASTKCRLKPSMSIYFAGPAILFEGLLEVIEQRLTDSGFEETAEKIVGEIQHCGLKAEKITACGRNQQRRNTLCAKSLSLWKLRWKLRTDSCVMDRSFIPRILP